MSQKYWVYVLRSLGNGKRYIGFTSRDPLVRLAEHNEGANRWTKQNRPFSLIHKEVFENSTEARKRELFLKSGQGRKWLDGVFLDEFRGSFSQRPIRLRRTMVERSSGKVGIRICL